VNRFPWRSLLNHPREDRFDAWQFAEALTAAGLTVVTTTDWRGDIGWFIAERGGAVSGLGEDSRGVEAGGC
jgi:hypothetical protein